MLNACATMPSHQNLVVTTPPSQIKAAQDKALVCFLRESQFLGGGVSYFIYDGELQIGGLRSGSYFIYNTDPGQHTFWAETETKVFVTLDLDAGQEYFVVGGVTMGAWIGHPTFTQVTPEVALPMLPDLDYTVFNPEPVKQ